MQIDPLQRSVRLSVRELAVFRNQALEQGHGRNAWRAAIGQEWHRCAEVETRKENTEARFEQSVEATWRHRDWEFQLLGRIDQLIPLDTGFLIREIKTIRSHLPAARESLLQAYPDHFAQTSIYHALLKMLPDYQEHSIESELLFINIENGARQSVRLETKDLQLFIDRLDSLIPFLEERRESRLRLKKADIRNAFETLRPGQAELFSSLHEAALKSKVVLLQAPTGFGKTGIVLEHALKHMQDGLYERCIYLSSQSTGQLETIRQLKGMIGEQIHFLQMRNRTEHRIDSPRHSCTGDIRCNTDIVQHWREADIHPPDLFKNGTVTTQQARTLGSDTGICPYAITKACLPFAEIWVGDSNYIFSPESRGVFDHAPGYHPERTLLVIDEAHNLPERTAANLSISLASADLLFAIEELRSHGAPRRLLSIGNELCRWIDALPIGQGLSLSALYNGQDLCEDFSKQLTEASFDYDSIAPFAVELAWSIPRMATSLAAPRDEYLNWKAKNGCLHATCLDASDWIQQCIEPFSSTILMSATLEPLDAFEASCGLHSEMSTHAFGQASWRADAYDVAIDRRVDTRFHKREDYYETTAQTVAACIHSSPGVPVAIFFSSYQYAQNVLTYLEAIHPEMRIRIQTRGADYGEQSQFIEESLLIADAIFLILGSSYAEGIDQLGGRIENIMIVGPALPEVNLIQETKLEQHHGSSRQAAFRDVYIRPAMRKVHQALGRIVRAPGHRAKVLLHGERFAENAYFEELAPEYRSSVRIDTEADLANWLEGQLP